METELLLPGEAARLLDMTPAGVKAVCARGQLEALRTSSGVHLFRRADVMALVGRRAQQRRGNGPQGEGTM